MRVFIVYGELLIYFSNGNLGNGEFISTSILQKAVDVPAGCYIFRLSGEGYFGNDLPSGNNYYKYGTACIYKRSNTSIIVVLYGEAISSPIAINYRLNNWSGWQTYVTNTDLQTERYMIPQPTPGNIFKAFDVWGCRVYKSGKIVTLRLNCACEMPASSNEHILFNLPEKYKPADDNIIINYITQKGINMMISIKNNGEFRLFNNNQTVPKNDWLLRQCITYVADN